MKNLLLVIAILLVLSFARQIFDSSIPCLSDDGWCETEGMFKDSNETLPVDDGKRTDPDKSPEDGPDPFGDYWYLVGSIVTNFTSKKKTTSGTLT